MEAQKEYIDYSFLNPYFIYYQDGFDIQLLQTDNPNEIIKNIWKSTKNTPFKEPNRGLQCVDFLTKIQSIPHPHSPTHEEFFIRLKDVVHSFIGNKIHKNKFGAQAVKLFNEKVSFVFTNRSEMNVLEEFSPQIEEYDCSISTSIQKRNIDGEEEKKSKRPQKKRRQLNDETSQVSRQKVIQGKILAYIKHLRSTQEPSFQDMTQSFDLLSRNDLFQLFGLRLDVAFDSDEIGFESNNEYMREHIEEQFDLLETCQRICQTNAIAIPQVIQDAYWFLTSIKDRFQ